MKTPSPDPFFVVEDSLENEQPSRPTAFFAEPARSRESHCSRGDSEHNYNFLLPSQSEAEDEHRNSTHLPTQPDPASP